ncbi:hypothetical protein FHN55_13555 [Streptomyces sp. NP160]|uniref:hypothetical protein n=1 Tax=Streptomyces sp. NP160 TaxID=2586637 RepID=UPI00111B49B6|nr:hypothetical protein [Streptomyces sp. NP160]TNM64544.1 hypothetical protein FHN55_13555 [Streptomyces sp. NP160]
MATGQAHPPRSDVDVVLLGLSQATATAVAARLSHRFAGLCREVAAGAARLEDLEGDDDEVHGNRVFLRHYCVLLAGDDVTAGWPPFPAGARAARGSNGDITLRLRGWRQDAGSLDQVDAGLDPAPTAGERSTRRPPRTWRACSPGSTAA